MQSTNISNTISGFKSNCDLSLDHQALLKLIQDSHTGIQEESGLAFIPLISQSVKSRSSKRIEAAKPEEQIQDSEYEMFEKWYKTISCISTNDQYNVWLKRKPF